MKLNPHPRCSCHSCRQGLRPKWGKATKKATDKSFRRLWKDAARDMVTGSLDPEDYAIVIVSTPYTA